MKEIVDTKLVQLCIFADFLREVEQNIKLGYELDFVKNEMYPIQIGNYYVCGMVKYEDKPVQVSLQETVEEPKSKPAAKRK